MQVFAPALIHAHEAADRQVRKNTHLANNLEEGLTSIIKDAIQNGLNSSLGAEAEKHVRKTVRTAAASADVPESPATQPRVELAPSVGYARPDKVKLVFPWPGKGFQGLQEMWSFYKTHLREGGSPSWHSGDRRSRDTFGNYKPLLLQVSQLSRPDNSHEAAVLGVMQRMMEKPKVRPMCFEQSKHACASH